MLSVGVFLFLSLYSGFCLQEHFQISALPSSSACLTSIFSFLSNSRKLFKSVQLLEHQYLMEVGLILKYQFFKAILARRVSIAHYGYLSQIKFNTLLEDRLFFKLIMTVLFPAVFIFLLCVSLPSEMYFSFV